MNDQRNKNFYYFIVVFMCVITTLFIADYFRNKSTTGSAGSTITEFDELRSDIDTIRSENERLTNERARLISELSDSNGKLESITTELQQFGETVANQAIEYSKRIERVNDDIYEYNRIYTERIFELCDTMEGTIRIIAEACGFDNLEIE